MKKLLNILLLFLFTSCNYKTDIKENGFNYDIVDTTYISENSFGDILSYYVIIKMDSSLYSAYMSTYGNVYKIERKLKINHCKLMK